MPFFSVNSALNTLRLRPELKTAIANKSDIWDTFGKKNSHLLRAKLYKLFDAENLSMDGRMMIHILFSAIKNLNRVKEHLDSLPEEITSLKEMAEARNFMDRRLVQYVTQENNQKFAVVHLPTTMPGLDLLLMAIMNDYDESFLMDEMVGKMTFTQMDIDEDLQSSNRAAQVEFWNETVTTSKNPNQDIYRQNKGFNQKYYDTASSDKYQFINEDFSVFRPANQRVGMTEEDLKKWYRAVKGENNPPVMTPPTTTAS